MRRSLRLPVALLATVLVAEAAVMFFRPRDLGPDPVPVQARAYFSQAEISRAEDFRGGQQILFLVRTAAEIGLLVALVRRAPTRRLTERLGGRKVLAGAATGAVVSLVLGLAPLPLRYIGFERARDVGLITQSIPAWLGDVAKSEAIGAGYGALGGAALVFGLRRFRRHWWIPGSAAVVAFGVATTMLTPVVLDPLFNDFERLPDGALRQDVLRLARASDVEVGEVYVVDASRRTTAANAYVAGLGRTKRVVLYDNLVKQADPAETRSVVAHELGHVEYHDVRNGLIFLAIVAPLGLFTVSLIGARLGASDDDLRPEKAVPAVALALAIVVPVVTSVSNQLSRAVERRADVHALEITREPQALVDLQVRLAKQNVSDPDPPAVWHFLFGTHPTTVQRIGLAKAFTTPGPAAEGSREGP